MILGCTKVLETAKSKDLQIKIKFRHLGRALTRSSLEQEV